MDRWYEDRATGMKYKIFRVTSAVGGGSMEVKVEKFEIEQYGVRRAVLICAIKQFIDDPTTRRIWDKLVQGLTLEGRRRLQDHFEANIVYTETTHDVFG